MDGNQADPDTGHGDRLRVMAPPKVTKNSRFNRAVDLLLVDLALPILAALMEVIA